MEQPISILMLKAMVSCDGVPFDQSLDPVKTPGVLRSIPSWTLDSADMQDVIDKELSNPESRRAETGPHIRAAVLSCAWFRSYPWRMSVSEKKYGKTLQCSFP